MHKAPDKQNALPLARKGVDTSLFQECDASVSCKVSHFLEQIKEVDNFMAERRMFAKKVVQSARFLKMPKTSQCLYFHLGMQADDDGVVEAYPVMNMIKAQEDDLQVLIGRNFVKVLNEDMVAYLVDWADQNRIRKDRKQDSRYKELLLQVMPDLKLLEKVPRSDTKKKDKSGPSTDGPWTAQYSAVEDSTGEDSTGQGSGGIPPDTTAAAAAGTEKSSTVDVPKFHLGEEILTEEAYQELVTRFGRENVDPVIRKILEKPYMHCLNPKVIGEWSSERKKRLEDASVLPAPETKPRKNGFHNFQQREYNYEELERQLLASQAEKLRNREEECVCQ